MILITVIPWEALRCGFALVWMPGMLRVLVVNVEVSFIWKGPE